MSLINRIEVSNFLDSKRDPSSWRPDFRWVTMNFYCLSTAFKATNGIGKTSLTNGIFALLTWKKTYLEQLIYALAPADEPMSHIRLELIRPFRDADGRDYLLDTLFKVQGESWVLGMCLNRGGDPQFYHYQGRLEDAPLGWWDGNMMYLHEDKDILNAATVKGKRVTMPTDWRQFVHRNHISKHHLGMLENFHRQGGGDNSADLFPVQEKGDEPYDRALFYAHIAPQLMVGLHKPGDDESGEEEYFFEDTLIRSSQRLCETKFNLEKSQAELDSIKETFEGMRKLAATVDAIDAARDEYLAELAKVAEIGAIIKAITESGLPGFPNRRSSGDAEIDMLVEYMVAKAGDGPALWTPGMDALLKKPEGRTVELLSKSNMPSQKVTQLLEINDHKAPANDTLGRSKHGRCLTEDEALTFIGAMSSEALGIAGPNLDSERQRLSTTIRTLFAHFRERIDTSPHRAVIEEIKKDKAKIEQELKTTIDTLKAMHGNLERTRRLIEEFAGPRSQWERLRTCSAFTEKDLEDPLGLKGTLDKALGEADSRIESLTRTLGGIREMGARLEAFRKKYGLDTPLEVEKSIRNRIDAYKTQAATMQDRKAGLDRELRDLSDECDRKNRDLLERTGELAVMDTLETSVAALKEEWEGWDATRIARELGLRREAAQRSIDASQEAVRSAKTAVDSLRDLARRAKDLFGRLERNMSKREQLSKGLALLDGYHAKYGDAAPPGVVLQAHRERRHRLIVGEQKLQSRIREWTSVVDALESKGVAPGRISSAALALVPAQASWRPLWQCIHESGLPPADRAQALVTLSSLLFSPVLEDAEAALQLAKLFEEKGYPVPVFLADGAGKALRSGKLDELAASVQGNMGEAAELLVHPERKQKRIDRHTRLIEAGRKGLGKLASLLAPLQDAAPEMIFLADAEKARLADVRNRDEALGREAQELAQEHLEIRKALLAMAGELGAGPQIEIAPDMPAEAMIPIIGQMSSHAADATTRLEKTLKADREALQDFEKKYGPSSRFIVNLAQAGEYAQKGGYEEHSRLKALAISLKEDLAAMDQKRKAKRKGRDDLVQEAAVMETALFTENVNLDEFDFIALQAFIESGEGRDTDRLHQELNQEKHNRTGLLSRMVFDFEQAAKYVPVRLEDLRRHEMVKGIEESLDRLEKRRDDQREQAGVRQKEIDAMAEAALAYDMQLVSIYGTVRQFEKLLEDIVEVKHSIQGEAAARIQGLIREIAQSPREGLPGLFEKAAEIAETLHAFNAQSKVERAKTAKNRVADMMRQYENECRLFLREEKGRLVEALEREVLNSVANPTHIRNVLENTARIVQEKQEKLAISQREHAVIWDDQIVRLAGIAEKARDTFKLLQRVCAKHESGATYCINANMTTPEEIEQAVTEIRDRVSYSVEKEEKDVEEGKITRERLKKKRRQKNGELYEAVRKILYKTIFKAPTIHVRHPAIAAGQKIRVERKNVSEGQSTALKLLLLVRLAEFSKERDARRDTPVARLRRKISGHEHSFIILDGIFSNLSDDSLIDESLKALGACKGVFQLIGLIHNKGYVNNYDIFPTFVVAKPFKSGQVGLSQDYWYDVECSHNGQTGIWQSTIVGKRKEQ